MSKFKVGDVVVAKENNGYIITTDGWNGVVVEVNSGCIIVQACDGYERDEGRGFEVNPTRFDFKDSAEVKLEDEKLKIDYKSLEKVVVDNDIKKSIISVLKQHENSKKIFDEWGLKDVIEYGRGMTMLFWGQPGTGKTWMSHCIARATGKKLQVVDTALLQSSTPGEMERNLKAEFAKAGKDKTILMFDECDSLLMTRDYVGMIIGSEINCLLTEIEKFEGICILTTNRIEELDKALERRISLTIEFKEPTDEQRIEIWKKHIPKKMPLDKVNIKELGETYNLTGGLIKNAVLNAARLAVSEDQESVSMDHFDRAIKTMMKGKKAFAKEGRGKLNHPRKDRSPIKADEAVNV